MRVFNAVSGVIEANITQYLNILKTITFGQPNTVLNEVNELNFDHPNHTQDFTWQSF